MSHVSWFRFPLIQITYRMTRASFYSISRMPQKGKLFCKRKLREAILISCLLEKADYTPHSKQNSSPYSFRSIAIRCFSRGGGKPYVGYQAEHSVCCLLVGVIITPSAYRGSAGITQDEKTFLSHFSPFQQNKSITAKNLVLILPGSRLEWKYAFWRPSSLPTCSAELAEAFCQPSKSWDSPVTSRVPALPGGARCLPGTVWTSAQLCVSITPGRRARVCSQGAATPGTPLMMQAWWELLRSVLGAQGAWECHECGGA